MSYDYNQPGFCSPGICWRGLRCAWPWCHVSAGHLGILRGAPRRSEPNSPSQAASGSHRSAGSDEQNQGGAQGKGET